jgi:hypothetical protein
VSHEAKIKELVDQNSNLTQKMNAMKSHNEQLKAMLDVSPKTTESEQTKKDLASVRKDFEKVKLEAQHSKEKISKVYFIDFTSRWWIPTFIMMSSRSTRSWK